jgi:hypothetical protein
MLSALEQALGSPMYRGGKISDHGTRNLDKRRNSEEIQLPVLQERAQNATISASIFIHSVIVYKCIDYRVI